MTSIENKVTGDTTTTTASSDVGFKTKLFNRTAELQIGDIKFECPPFSLEYEHIYAVKMPWCASILLYNPADETIAKAQKKGTNIQLQAGYNPYKDTKNWGTCLIGVVESTEVENRKTERILKIVVKDKSQDKLYTPLKNSYRNQPISGILRSVLSEAGLSSSNSIDLGSGDTTLTTFVPHTLKYALDNLCKLSKTNWHFDEGILRIHPNDLTKGVQILTLSKSTGLVETVQECYDKTLLKQNPGKKLIRFKTLFLYQMKLHSDVKIVTEQESKMYKIIAGKKRFATHRSTYCEWEAISV